MRIPRWLSGKESTCQCRYQKCGFNTWLGRSPGEGNGKQLQRSCLDNPMDRAVSGGLQFIGWQRVGCDSTHTRTHSYIYIYTHIYTSEIIVITPREIFLLYFYDPSFLHPKPRVISNLCFITATYMLRNFYKWNCTVCILFSLATCYSAYHF